MAKTKEEIEFDEACDRYIEKFGKPYPCVISVVRSIKKHTEIMNEAIKSGKKVPEPKYEKGCLY